MLPENQNLELKLKANFVESMHEIEKKFNTWHQAKKKKLCDQENPNENESRMERQKGKNKIKVECKPNYFKLDLKGGCRVSRSQNQ